MQISSQTTSCVDSSSGGFEFNADCRKGSSGSPVFVNWRLVGILHSGIVGRVNCGTMLVTILERLRLYPLGKPFEGGFVRREAPLSLQSGKIESFTSTCRSHPIDLCYHQSDRTQLTNFLAIYTMEPLAVFSDSCVLSAQTLASRAVQYKSFSRERVSTCVLAPNSGR